MYVKKWWNCGRRWDKLMQFHFKLSELWQTVRSARNTRFIAFVSYQKKFVFLKLKQIPHDKMEILIQDILHIFTFTLF
jgi:hypothetical protein